MLTLWEQRSTEKSTGQQSWLVKCGGIFSLVGLVIIVRICTGAQQRIEASKQTGRSGLLATSLHLWCGLHKSSVRLLNAVQAAEQRRKVQQHLTNVEAAEAGDVLPALKAPSLYSGTRRRTVKNQVPFGSQLAWQSM